MCAVILKCLLSPNSFFFSFTAVWLSLLSLTYYLLLPYFNNPKDKALGLLEVQGNCFFAICHRSAIILFPWKFWTCTWTIIIHAWFELDVTLSINEYGNIYAFASFFLLKHWPRCSLFPANLSLTFSYWVSTFFFWRIS